MEMHFQVFRYDPAVDAAPRYQDYAVETKPEERILDCLNRIRWEQDGTLSYRMSCGHGVCGSDGMKINGRCALACQKLVKDYMGTVVVLEPLPHFPVLKDLVVDMDWFLQRIRQIRPYLLQAAAAPERERIQSPSDHKKLDTVIRCILCACCTAACPVMSENPDYVGPAALVWAYRLLFDSRDDQFNERLQQVDFNNGVWACANYFECTRVCPKEIPVTKSINVIKREIERRR
jgi:succinate dehydrogenase / fumarate reductase iron-sulfur subunit